MEKEVETNGKDQHFKKYDKGNEHILEERHTNPPGIPDAAWKRTLSNKFKDHQPSMVSLGHGLKLASLGYRIYKYGKKERSEGRLPIIDPFNFPKPGPLMGVPIGGIGSGSIGRGWRGDFCRWQIAPTGVAQFKIVEADQFSVFVQRKGKKGKGMKKATVLSPNKPSQKSLSSWSWNLDATKSNYYALFPRAWTTYEVDPSVHLTCKQISPVIPHNYKESSYPVGVFEWKIENSGDSPVDVSIMFTFQNGTGSENDTAGGHYNQYFRSREDISATGIILYHRQRQTCRTELHEDPLSFCIAALETDGATITYDPNFVTNNAGGCKYLWEDFSDDGALHGTGEKGFPSPKGASVGAALCVKVSLEPHESKKIVFSLAWDCPITRFASGEKYSKRYTKFFGNSGDCVQNIAIDALKNYQEWEKEIIKWQEPVLIDDHLPNYYKGALFNELYYLVDGGTVWTVECPTAIDRNCQRKHHNHETSEEIGHFAYLEGLEYLMYNTYDVHFYASFALIMLFPKLELSLQRDIAFCTLLDYQENWQTLHSGKIAPRKKMGAVPHDLGNPGESPWNRVNSYNIQDISRWKDLPSKFILQVYRDYIFSNDAKFLSDMWEAVEATANYALHFDTDGDGVVDNEGFPDQTYDTWSVVGCSAYSGGLWLAAVAAVIEMSKILELDDVTAKFAEIHAKGKKSYHDKLWNGKYYNYDSSTSPQHDSIMADMMAGQWYAKACGLDPIVPESNAYSSLKTIFDFNVKGFKQGSLGAVNGMRPDGTIDQTCMQSLEVWTGTTYALAAAMLQQGLKEEAFETAKGIIHSTYETLGYHFQTPEAWTIKGHYRSAAYMRPLCIWGMQYAWNRFYSETEVSGMGKMKPTAPGALCLDNKQLLKVAKVRRSNSLSIDSPKSNIQLRSSDIGDESVSYTHLTLPTT
eukprot:TRINITY_DN1816_c0_g1_i1.p1 TRINITY_DN1816_c0_g1~~TRINITY_DN1816_c0_g1_i1.p1  ORF type:complete len:922 (-),score=224.06 TRINITY_DN1816_c0_g1_i1:38-2803(-)